jgi:RHS repeat-associated protein
MNATTNKTGLGIVLKVMSGDEIAIFGKSFHKIPAGGQYSDPISPLSVFDLINMFTATPVISPKGVTTSQIVGAPGFPATLPQLLGIQQPQTSTTLQASINWIIFDEQFKYVSGGFDLTGSSALIKTHNLSTIPTIVIPKNGYVYVFCSNESNYNVFFDNLQVIHTKGQLLEETHYYPFGLVMSGISSKSASSLINRQKFTGKELQSQEFSDGSGLEWTDFGARMYDNQIGRWHAVDPLTHETPFESPYSAMGNNPILNIDPDGQSWEPIGKDGKVVQLSDKENINGYRWVGYDKDDKGNMVARANTVETAYTFGAKGMTTLSSEGYKANTNWQAYEDISTGDKRADANIASLDPRVQNQMKAVVLELKLRHGIDVKGGDQGGFRTYAEQDAIFARGASKAKGGQSNHNFAIAMDVAIFENGKYLNKGSEWQYKTYGNVAKKQGLMWGGDWKSFFDPAHIEYKHNSTMKELRALPKDKNGFFITLP